MPDGSDHQFRAFIHDFLAFSAQVTQIRNGFGEFLGLSGVAYTTLRSVAFLQDKRGIGVNELAEHLHLSSAFVTIEVAKLVKAGLIEKRMNKADRRRVLLTVSAKGRAKLDELVTLQAPVNDALFESLTESEFLDLAKMIRRLVVCGDHARSLLELLKSERATAAKLAEEREAAI
jgi:MarR family transcriptional regulator, organic hydroperoxide resistance regulator